MLMGPLVHLTVRWRMLSPRLTPEYRRIYETVTVEDFGIDGTSEDIAKAMIKKFRDDAPRATLAGAAVSNLPVNGTSAAMALVTAIISAWWTVKWPSAVAKTGASLLPLATTISFMFRQLVAVSVPKPLRFLPTVKSAETVMLPQHSV